MDTLLRASVRGAASFIRTFLDTNLIFSNASIVRSSILRTETWTPLYRSNFELTPGFNSSTWRFTITGSPPMPIGNQFPYYRRPPQGEGDNPQELPAPTIAPIPWPDPICQSVTWVVNDRKPSLIVAGLLYLDGAEITVADEANNVLPTTISWDPTPNFLGVSDWQTMSFPSNSMKNLLDYCICYLWGFDSSFTWTGGYGNRGEWPQELTKNTTQYDYLLCVFRGTDNFQDPNEGEDTTNEIYPGSIHGYITGYYSHVV
jgi:hypothetical protein